jgi:hypothetical protein
MQPIERGRKFGFLFAELEGFATLLNRSWRLRRQSLLPPVNQQLLPSNARGVESN